MTLGQGHDTPFGHGQQLSEILYYQDRTRGLEVMVRTRCEQTDRQTDGQGYSYIAPFVCGEGGGGIIIYYGKRRYLFLSDIFIRP